MGAAWVLSKTRSPEYLNFAVGQHARVWSRASYSPPGPLGKGTTLELRDYLRVLRKGWTVVLACVLAGIAVGAVLVLTTTKIYEATTQLFVAASSATSQTANDLSEGNTFAQDQVQSYTFMATSPTVTGAVIKDLGLDMTTRQLAQKIKATAPLNRVLINVSVQDTNPAQAAKLSNAVALEFSKFVEATVQTESDKPVVKLTVIHPASAPNYSIKPRKTLDIGLGLVAGLILGIAIVLIREMLDNTVKSPADFEKLGLPVLGLVPYDKRTSSVPIAFRDDAHGTRAEAYRQMRTNLQFVSVDHAPKLIAITSAVPGEGKSTTALNLSAALAEAGADVCLVEADLRRPTLAKVLGLSGDVGFTTALVHKASVDEVIQSGGPHLDILTSGPIPPNPSELLLTEQARSILKLLADKYDYVIIDTAPLLPVTDGAQVATIADATVVVHHAGRSTKDQVARCLAVLENVGETPVGAVLNMITKQRGTYDYNYGYYYSYRPRGKS